LFAEFRLKGPGRPIGAAYGQIGHEKRRHVTMPSQMHSLYPTGQAMAAARAGAGSATALRTPNPPVISMAKPNARRIPRDRFHVMSNSSA
jgi:hypothetical protein